jgi:hypothetical protein
MREVLIGWMRLENLRMGHYLSGMRTMAALLTAPYPD